MDEQQWKFTEFVTTKTITTTTNTRRSTCNELQKKRMGMKPLLRVFRPPKLYIPTSRSRSIKRQPFEFGMGSIIVQELGYFEKGSKNVTT
jgi:hypothetical protein